MSNNLRAKEVSQNTNGNYVQANTGLQQAILAMTEQRDIAVTTADVDLTTGAADGQTTTSNVYKALRSAYLKFTDTMDDDHNVILPTDKKLYFVEHDAAGGFTITVKTASGTGVDLVNGQIALVRCDGTDIILVALLSGSGVGSVSSVALTVPSQEFSVSGSPITTSGTLAVSKKAVNAVGNSTGAVTLNFNNGDVQTFTLTGNVTFTFSNPVNGQVYKLLLTQDGTGGRTITWPAAMKWAGGALVLTAAASAVDSVSFFYDGTNYYEVSRALNIG
jgi:hypothetical protein